MRAGVTIEPDEGDAPALAEDTGAPEQADGYEESAPEEPLPAETAVDEPEASPEAPATNESVEGGTPTEKTLDFDPGTT
jgi:hypothetical protein